MKHDLATWDNPLPTVLAFGACEVAAARACDEAGARLMRCASLADGDLPDRQSGAAATLVFGDGEDEHLSPLLANLNALSERTGTPVIAIVPPHLIDLAAALLSAPETRVMSDPAPDEIGSMLRDAIGPRGCVFHDASSEHSTLQLRKLSEDVERIARTLATLSADREVITLADAALEEGDEVEADSDGAAELLRALLRARRLRERFFAPELFSDPAWDMLLDLAGAALEHKRVAVSSLCIAASVPPTTALRYIKTMTDTGLFVRRPDRTDGRRVFIELSEQAFAAMLRYLGAMRRMIDVVT